MAAKGKAERLSLDSDAQFYQPQWNTSPQKEQSSSSAAQGGPGLPNGATASNAEARGAGASDAAANPANGGTPGESNNEKESQDIRHATLAPPSALDQDRKRHKTRTADPDGDDDNNKNNGSDNGGVGVGVGGKRAKSGGGSHAVHAGGALLIAKPLCRVVGHTAPGCAANLVVRSHGDKLSSLTVFSDHTCNGRRAHGDRTPYERDLLVRYLIMYGGDAKKALTAIRYFISTYAGQELPLHLHRLPNITLAQAREAADRLSDTANVDKSKVGADMSSLRNTFTDLTGRGFICVLKLPAQRVEVFCPSSGVDQGVLKSSIDAAAAIDDVFIAIIPPLARIVSKTFGSIIMTDGTHNIVKAYKKVKLVTASIRALSPDGQKARTIPLVHAAVISEARRLYQLTAVLVKFLGFDVKVVMSDLAAAAVNGWQMVYGEVTSVWCHFHLWRALVAHVKKEKPLENPEARVLLTAVYNFLHTCYTDDAATETEFGKLIGFAHASGFPNTSKVLDVYYKRNLHMFSARARMSAMHRAMPTSADGHAPLPPQLYVNNGSESFHSTLKRCTLEGAYCKSLTVFFGKLAEFSDQLYCAALRAGIINGSERFPAAKATEVDSVEDGVDAEQEALDVVDPAQLLDMDGLQDGGEDWEMYAEELDKEKDRAQ